MHLKKFVIEVPSTFKNILNLHVYKSHVYIEGLSIRNMIRRDMIVYKHSHKHKYEKTKDARSLRHKPKKHEIGRAHV